MVDMMECALKHVETQMSNLLSIMGDDPLSPEVGMVYVPNALKLLCTELVDLANLVLVVKNLHDLVLGAEYAS